MWAGKKKAEKFSDNLVVFAFEALYHKTSCTYKQPFYGIVSILLVFTVLENHMTQSLYSSLRNKSYSSKGASS